MRRLKYEEIVLSNRRQGSTTWILKAAIKNPDCVILTGTPQQATMLREQYHRMISKMPWIYRVIRKLKKKKHPIFLSIHTNFRGLRVPIIFDNSALL